MLVSVVINVLDVADYLLDTLTPWSFGHDGLDGVYMISSELNFSIGVGHSISSVEVM